MRLIKIGRSQDCDIVLSSQYSSGHHAELTLLDNGDIILVDTGSSNGTFVNGNKIVSGKEVTVTRRDTVAFADEILDWSSVPSIRLASDVKAVFGIGSNYRNSIQIDGTGVSRFHATVKQKKDGKWYICDHSSNGTVVNGMRIPKNQDYKITSKDEIICGGVSIPNPVRKTSSGGGKTLPIVIASIICAAAVVVGVLFGVGVLPPDSAPIPGTVTPEKIYKKYASSVALIEVGFYFQASCPLSGTSPLNYAFYRDEDGELDWYPWFGNNVERYSTARATGFFVSEDGKLVTNLHVADPVQYGIEESFAKRVKELYCAYYGNRPAFADVTVKTVYTYMRIVPNGKYNKEDNRVNCRIVNTSSNKDIDLAVLQTVTERLPEGATYVPLKIKSKMPIASKIYSLGYPIPFFLQDDGHDEVYIEKPVEATFTNGSITNVNRTTYGINATVAGGASGSPVFDEEGYLVGVVSKAFYNGQEYNQCEKAENIKGLLN